MDFIDDEAGVSDEDDVLVQSSQPSEDRRPHKRRRLNNGYHSISEDESPEPDLPSNDPRDDDSDWGDDYPQNKSKYEDRMHVPEHAKTQQDTFVTQVEQPWSSPTRMRGPRWRKQQVVPPASTVRPRPPPSPRPSANRPQPAPAPQTVMQPRASLPSPPQDDEFGGEDPDLLDAFLSHSQETTIGGTVEDAGQRGQGASFRQTTLFGMNTTQREATATQSARGQVWRPANRNEPPTHHGIDVEAMKTWVYPTNLGTIRDYQYNIVHTGLYNNLLVALPTGLGKTFIAATVMLNWFRWTKTAQIIFVAPTKPLVAQQMDACYNVVGIPRSQTTMLTGETPTDIRDEEWAEKRVFFMTPQTLINDLKHGRADPKKIVLVVVDEAHKATGAYAYVEVVKFMRRFTSSFRVLALTATPGASVEAVQKVIDGLDIARVEIRTEESLDIRCFVHSKEIQLEVFDYSDELQTCLDLFKAAVNPLLTKLRSQGAYWGQDATLMTQYGMRMAQQAWNKSDAAKSMGNAKWGINNTFMPLITLAHNLELLKYHGIGPFYSKMKEFEEGAEGQRNGPKGVTESEPYRKMMNYMRTWVNNPDFEGHPKLTYLKQVVLNHFMDASEGHRSDGRGPAETRIMIFAHYRSSAEEVVRVLKRHEMIRPCIFVGQTSTKGSEGMNQKAQSETIAKFKTGTFNTLVATSIGEEGLDIGEVDLIVCYDCSKSPIRMLQRMGRTGRKRAGNISVLLMRGKEENDYYKAKDGYTKMQEIIESGKHFDFHDDRSPRIVPREIHPVVDRRVVDIPVENTQGGALEPRKKKRKSKKTAPKKFHMPDGVETGFQFLGQTKSKTKKKATKPILDLEEASLPELQNVLLSSEEHVRLEQMYQQVDGTEPVYVTAPRLDVCPEAQRSLHTTSRVKHSSCTKTIVGIFSNTYYLQKDWTRPSQSAYQAALDLVQCDDQASQISPKRLRAVNKARSSTSHRSKSSRDVSPDSYDGADSFLDDASPAMQAVSPSSATSPEPAIRETKAAVAEEDQAFYVSQISRHLSQESDNDLPDLGELVGKHSAALPAGQKGTAVESRLSRRKRIIESDEDE